MLVLERICTCMAIATAILSAETCYSQVGGGKGFVVCASEPEGPTCTSQTGGMPCALGKTCQTITSGCDCRS